MRVPDSYSQPGASFAQLTEHLSEASVRHRWEAYTAIEWNDPAYEVDHADLCWEAPAWDPLGASDWYRDQSASRRSELGLYRVGYLLKVGIEFEAVLKRGLLRFASKLPNGHPAFRYVYHEITEEAQHSMMFQEMINHCKLDMPSSPKYVQDAYEKVIDFVDDSPALFFLAAMTGEEAFDHVQRMMLSEASVHPLMRRINQIHITEEARHLSFARGFLRDVIPRLKSHELRFVRYQAPLLIHWLTTHLFGPELLMTQLTDTQGMPMEVKDLIVRGVVAAEFQRQSTARVVNFCKDLDLVSYRPDSMWTRLIGGSKQ